MPRKRQTTHEAPEFEISGKRTRFPFAGNVESTHMTDVTRINGFRVTYREYPGFEFFLHHPVTKTGGPVETHWKLSEAKSGLGVGPPARTKEEAAKKGLESLRWNVESLKDLRARIEGGIEWVRVKRRVASRERARVKRESKKAAREDGSGGSGDGEPPDPGYATLFSGGRLTRGKFSAVPVYSRNDSPPEKSRVEHYGGKVTREVLH